MIPSSFIGNPCPAAKSRRHVLLAAWIVAFLAATLSADAQNPLPLPTAAPSAAPTITITPGLPSIAEMQAYNTARTPQVAVSLPIDSMSNSGTTNANMASQVAASFQPVILKGASTLINLQPAGGSQLQSAQASTASDALPAASVVLTYPNEAAGQVVWVQPLRGGTLTNTDASGKTYDGSHGFFLTLGAAGTATFRYQAPNQSGTYQVLTRYSNVTTALTFRVP